MTAPTPASPRALTATGRVELARILGRIEGKVDAALARRAVR